MSMFVQVQSIKASPALAYSQTQRPLTNSSLSRDVIVCVQHFLRSEYIQQTHKSKIDQQQWVLNKSIFSIPLAEQQTTAALLAGETKVNNYKLFSNNQDQFRVLLKTPISLLLSQDKRQRMVEKVQKSQQIPLYSDQCKIIVSFYLFDKQQNKETIFRSIQNDQPAERIQIKRKQIKEILKKFHEKPQQYKNNRNQSTLRPSSQKYTFDNYQANLTPIKSNPKTQQQYRTYTCTVQPKNTNLQIRHRLKIQFVLAVQKLRECAGFMLAGYSRGFSIDNKNSNINTQHNGSFSQYAANSNVSGSKVGYKNFGYDLNFSAVRPGGQKYVQHQSTGQKQKQIYEPDLKNSNRPIKQLIKEPIRQSPKQYNKAPVQSRIGEPITYSNRKSEVQQPKQQQIIPIRESRQTGTIREQPIKQHTKQKYTKQKYPKQASTINQSSQSSDKGFFMNAFNFACCKQAKNDEQNQINIEDPSSLNYESHKDQVQKIYINRDNSSNKQINKNYQTQAKAEAEGYERQQNYHLASKPTKIKQPKQRVNFYKGPCKNKNLFSMFDPKREDQIFTPMEPHYS